MSDKYPEPIGMGGIKIHEGKKGKYLRLNATFRVILEDKKEHEITMESIAFKNDRKKEDWQYDYNIKVEEAYPGKKRKYQPPANPQPKVEEESDIPF